MPPRLLADTHVVVRWLTQPERLSGEQLRALERAVRRGEPVAFSAMSLIEMAMLSSESRLDLHSTLAAFFDALRSNRVYRDGMATDADR